MYLPLFVCISEHGIIKTNYCIVDFAKIPVNINAQIVWRVREATVLQTDLIVLDLIFATADRSTLVIYSRVTRTHGNLNFATSCMPQSCGTMSRHTNGCVDVSRTAVKWNEYFADRSHNNINNFTCLIQSISGLL